MSLQQVTKSYLNVKRDFYGLRIPCQFKLYGSYENSVRSDYQIVLANPAYRQKLGETLSEDYFDQIGVDKQQSDNVSQQAKEIADNHSNHSQASDSKKQD